METSDEKNADIIDIHNLQEAARNASAYYREQHSFQRNAKLTWLVHAIFNAAQFLTASMQETFHHLHHSIVQKMREKNPDIPELPEERHPVFFIYPICMAISLVLGILWFLPWILRQNPGCTAIVCGICACLMLINGIFAMKFADDNIDENEVSDAELLNHPIFIHNFTLCIFSIFGMSLYLLQGWILFSDWQWKRKSGLKSGLAHKTTESDRPNSSEIKPVPELSELPKSSHKDTNPEDEPVILYCCCVDCFHYLIESRKEKPEHEFQVVHIL